VQLNKVINNGQPLTDKEIGALSVSELKAELRNRALRSTGTKQELMERLLEDERNSRTPPDLSLFAMPKAKKRSAARPAQ
jgi:hypothetical protein